MKKHTLDIEPMPVAVYCTIKKKCVLLFKSNNMCDRYVFNTTVYKTSRTRYLTSANGKTAKNAFNKMLAFRIANTQQKELLGNDDMLVLDKEFVRENIKVQSQFKVREYMNERIS